MDAKDVYVQSSLFTHAQPKAIINNENHFQYVKRFQYISACRGDFLSNSQHQLVNTNITSYYMHLYNGHQILVDLTRIYGDAYCSTFYNKCKPKIHFLM